MTDISKLVSQRLQASSSLHPDADLLNAFAENALRGTERAHVLEHLWQCQDCRHVLALALPEAEAPVALPAPSGSWLRWPVLRWVASAAAVVVVGAAVSLRFSAHQAKPVATLSPLISNQVALVGSESSAPKVQYQATAPSEFEHAAPAKKAVAQRPRLEADQAASAERASEVKSAPAVAPTPAKPAPIPAPDLVASGGLAKDLNSPRSATTAPIRQTAAVHPPTSGAQQKIEVSASQVAQSARNDAALPASGAVSALVSRTRPAISAASNAAAPADATLAPRWTLTAEGILLRSIDEGRTWTTVPVADGASFRALSATGGHIWVAGSSARLFHSSDGGAHWQQMKPAADGQSLTADIIGVEFTDPQHGKLTTADHQTWLTSDAGQTWHIQ